MDRQEREEAGRQAIESIESLSVSDVGDIVLNIANNIETLRKNARFSEEERELFNQLDQSFQELALGRDPGVEEEVEEKVSDENTSLVKVPQLQKNNPYTGYGSFIDWCFEHNTGLLITFCVICFSILLAGYLGWMR